MEPKREHIYWPLQDFDNLVAERIRMNREEAKEMMLGYFKNARHIPFFTPEQHAEKLCDLLEAYGLFTVDSNTLPIPAHPETVKYDRIDALSEKVKALEGVLNEYRKVTDQRISGCEDGVIKASLEIGDLRDAESKLQKAINFEYERTVECFNIVSAWIKNIEHDNNSYIASLRLVCKSK